jgi:hypothetical protein
MKNLLHALSSALVPSEILQDFDITEVAEDDQGSCVITLVEKEGVSHIPKEVLHEGKVIQNGYCNPLELHTFPAKGKPVLLKLIRRRWKLKKTGESAYNTYNYHYEGMKATKEFGDFLKGSH